MALILEHEQTILDEFRLMTEDLSLDDVTLVRFLRARDLNPKKAEEMLRKTVEWRETNDLISVMKWNAPATVLKDFRMYFTGLDNQGYPVYVIPLGKWDGRKILGSGLKEDVVRYMQKTIEVIMGCCKEKGVSKFNVILDMEGLSLWKVAHWDSVETTLRVIKDFEANYPETLTAAYLINTPSVFWQAFKFVKPILAGNTLKKIHIFDSDKSKWTAALLENIPTGSLPNIWGGDGQAIDVHSS